MLRGLVSVTSLIFYLVLCIWHDRQMGVLVTGASSGIGRAFALHYAAEGSDMILAARSPSGLSRVSDEVTALGGRARSIAVDLSSAAGVDLLIDACDDVETIVANAGVTLAAPIGSIDRDEVDATAYLMTAGIARLCDALVPAMVAARRGDVIIVSSIAAFVPMRKSAAYAASKAFSTSYARSLDLEVRSSGVRVAALCPGYVRTDLHRHAGLDHLSSKIPSWMWLEPEDVVVAAQRALSSRRVVTVPGIIYRIVRPFLSSRLVQVLWQRLTRRR